ncbi:U6 snRNA-associated Sm-like protein LSm1, putative [Plasmodium chabaudi chabaudi]|uniref:U6 snRNA-associated Sm-like protein LSm1 n=2 Tax=Plasmodium chabaudi TaxID=5825 RepID=A0A077XET2_PLACU|nr:U6 snRNA-associated Sm-like protein LSm1, putative [Plasmodium chabaudi chabaudi]SCM21082.1 U6 snRNA-associated Sm-like protein LSm1, putative [Plasmodium chabaudi adami]SCM22144.1 U6 snRNA-associated Sm-like protein LSm1, putative [Plasmodium chabaudi chabaudi]SCN60419.1 U6 snRNA-associated Sm-like protein LSm1, putative [Plasmodium chabaudi chabaudi]SCN60420.1 U6 snRNA-associated Sm-like protein LSm1, putative [Plasmodium chabaudi adami]VTZ68812.1 U6 snRNA-associated Sm-like protein LSm1,|eukprot:XP_743323.2 U6 snRNA-associated Sm-like protein LSm1, putative [Plasmodium chabaudi chabaudi]
MEQIFNPLWLSSFEEDIDTYIFISSRDNKLYLGILRTYDQHGNIFLTHCVEKIIIPEQNYFSDVYVGNLIIRGDNIAYFGSIDESKYEKMFNYSQKDINENSQGENLYEENKKEDIILNYKPINQILKYIDKANNDSTIFEN